MLLSKTLCNFTRFNANGLRRLSSEAYTEDGLDYVESIEIRMVR